MDSFEAVQNDAIEQLDRPASLTRKDAEKICREIISSHLGEELPDNLFQDSVNELMEEINGAEVKD